MKEEPDAAAKQALFDAGTEVGVLAQQLFPHGKKIEYKNSSFAQKKSQTRKYIEKGASTIYEATFSHGNILVMVDILHKGKNEILEGVNHKLLGKLCHCGYDAWGRKQ